MKSTSKIANNLLTKSRKSGIKIVTAESCTGGMVASGIVAIAGSSDVFERGFVTYSNNSKIEELGVSKNTLEKYGAVSEQVASAMALGALKNSAADLSVAITGIAGPGGGNNQKPVGLVYIATCTKNAQPKCKKYIFSGDRTNIRISATEKALEMLLDAI